MSDCIVVKGVQFKHSIIYDGPGDGVHCHFCQKHWDTRADAEREFHENNMLELPTTREQDDACLQLEETGQRFLVDFGYENAEAKLAVIRAERLEHLASMDVD